MGAYYTQLHYLYSGYFPHPSSLLSMFRLLCPVENFLNQRFNRLGHYPLVLCWFMKFCEIMIVHSIPLDCVYLK